MTDTNTTVKSKKKPIALMITAIIVVLLLAGTFLWFTAKGSIQNIFHMDVFKVVITEGFDPNTPVTPGANIKKDVKVENQGDSDVAVRVMIEEELQLLALDGEGNPDIEYSDTKHDQDDDYIKVTMSEAQVTNLADSGYTKVDQTDNADVDLYSRTVDSADNTESKTEYVAYTNDGVRQVAKYDPADKSVTYAYYKKGDVMNGEHGLASGTAIEDLGITFMPKTPADWELDSTTGWTYYTKLLPGGQSTTSLLESVQFASNIDNKMKGATLIITPKMEAIQGEDEAAADEGWNATISGTTLTVGRP